MAKDWRIKLLNQGLPNNVSVKQQGATLAGKLPTLVIAIELHVDTVQ